jgi:hypothetical protein
MGVRRSDTELEVWWLGFPDRYGKRKPGWLISYPPSALTSAPVAHTMQTEIEQMFYFWG